MKPYKKTMQKQAKYFAMLLFAVHTLNISSSFASKQYTSDYKLTQQTTELKVLLTSGLTSKTIDQDSITRLLPDEKHA